MANNLTKKQLKFCQEYLKDYNATQAYKRAGYSANSDNTARVEGCKLLIKPNIKAKIAELSENVAKKTEIEVGNVIKEIANISFSNIQDYYKEDGNLKSLNELSREQAKCIKSMTPLKDGGFKIELYDKNSSLDKLMKYFGGYEAHNKQKVVESAVDYTQLPTDVLERILEFTKNEDKSKS